ncbi:hypothetical protein DEU56DRAFT_945673 [Suillus clintonianus]|uniref:uncharacterized protein n=1 Tax=Suillus clintonianus TaxID=1904413 RepID=UPI001B8715C6|nr:uncharacterized protein DEU56DRAFT_945673 [Suillus clintonianus]KAG2137966.1 hypothetical protein DEU56DRAFT_945673 [Suillus clintonianus]
MLQFPDLPMFDNMQLVLGAAASLGVINGLKSTVLLLLFAQDLRKSLSSVITKPVIPCYLVISRLDVLLQAAVDTMKKQGASLVDRPRMVADGEMLSGGLAIGFTHAGDKLRRMGRVLHTHLQPKVAEEYQSLQMSHAKNVVLDILEDPANFMDHAAVKNSPTSATDPEVKEVRQRFEKLHIVLRPGAYLVDSIRWLKFIPLYGQDLRKEFETSKKLYSNQLSRVQQQMRSIWLFLLAASSQLDLIRFNNVSTKAPTLADEQSLPRLRAFISKAMRWRPFAPNVCNVYTVGLGHRTTKEVIWPDRWINDEGGRRDDLNFFAYGFGRRSVFITSLLVLWAFHLTLGPTKPLDDTGYISGLPPKFKPCSIDFKTKIPEGGLNQNTGRRRQVKGTNLNFDLEHTSNL